ncbi:hypothetical protein E2562_028631 [Oryza meyeriana var. granulata]|uniref:Glycosyltransferase 61 catalytic domain-containing protein n=1 Tax=Oryza meyeriana var. granulata TaxID=110450 RepID=A0A6G1FCW4_9ORYZ|nr:hypothetical protein E2562_028631 [Oryza meyeriana var. granulata]
MRRGESRGTRGANRSLSSSWKSSYIGYGLVVGFVLVLLYLMVTTQFSNSPTAYLAGPATISKTKQIPAATHQENHAGREDGSREMEERYREEVARTHTEPSKGQRQEEKVESEQLREERNPIEEQLGNETNSGNWEDTHQPEKKGTIEFSEFGGGTDDFNNVANTKPICDTSFGKYDICVLDGDARAQGGAAATVTLVSPRAAPREWKIKPYSRKYLDGLKAVTVKSVPNPEDAPQCTTQLNVPAMVIELGGLTGNYWHDFTDVLIPLFIGARRFSGEVQLLVVNLLPFWVHKYRKIFSQISRHEIIDLDKDHGVVRCYPHVVVGYGSRKEFTIDPSLDDTGGGYTMVNFTEFLRHSYSLPRDRPIKLISQGTGGAAGLTRPRMMILERTNSRKLMNLPEVVTAAEAAGFEVTVAGRPRASYDEFAREVNSFDVMLGVHGAGLTNCVFLPTGAVLVQIVPYGRLENIAQTDFGDPARDMGLRYIEYGIAAEESSLMDVFGKDHPMIKDPIAVHMSGWGNVAEWYLGKQDVRVNIDRFRPILIQVLEHLR